MWQLSEAIDGMAEACLALGLPVIGGNVSLYNESFGADIDPTPVDRRPRASSTAWPPDRRGSTLVDGGTLVLLDASVGRPGTPATDRRRSPGRAGPSSCATTATERCPRSTWPAHGRLVDFVADLVAEGVAGGDGLVAGIHDVSGGGLGVALAELAVRSGVGVQVSGVADHHELFTEAPSRVVVCTTDGHDAPVAGGRRRHRLPGARHGRRRPHRRRRPGRPRRGRDRRGTGGADCPTSSTTWPPSPTDGHRRDDRPVQAGGPGGPPRAGRAPGRAP